MIDNKLSFFDHLAYLKANISRYVVTVAKVGNAYWGVSPCTIRMWYLSVIEPKLLYAVEAWFGSLNCHGRQKFLSIQRCFLLKILRCYRTVSNAALYTLTGIPPITMRSEIRLRFTEVVNRGQEILIDDNAINGVDIERKNLKYNLDPRDYPKNVTINTGTNLKEVYNKDCEISVNIYTDGSKTPGGVGFGVVVFGGLGIVSECSQSMNKNNTVYQAEMCALEMAVKMAGNMRETHFNIMSDSQSSLKSLDNIYPKSPIAQRILQCCGHMSEKVFNFIWVKAHSGNPGNEYVDILAKEATEKCTVDCVVRLPEVYLKTYLKNKMMRDWQCFWDNAEGGRYTYKIWKSVSLAMCFESTVLNYFATGHGSFPAFLNRIGKADSPNCTCGEIGDSLHYLQRSCSYSSEFIALRINESFESYFDRIDRSPSLMKTVKIIYNKLNRDYSFIFSSV